MASTFFSRSICLRSSSLFADSLLIVSSSCSNSSHLSWSLSTILELYAVTRGVDGVVAPVDIAAAIDIRLIRAPALLVVAPMLSLLCAAELVLARLVDEGLDSTFLGFGDATGVVRLLLEGGKCILLISLRDIRRPSSLDMAPFVFDFAFALLLCGGFKI